MTYSDDLLRTILTETKTIACVGMSLNPNRASHEVSHYLHERGYRIIPVNPGHVGTPILGEVFQPDLSAARGVAQIDMVDVFRRSETVPEVVDDALVNLPDLKVIWMQLGVQHAEAAARAEAAGVTVIQNRCPKIEYARLIGR
ncbi:CoA-binding protein [Aliiroseovarius sp. YM-037]|uniref:CoA-binding protein n=1 Tax=Aliiroseovarius sp. YM-037 TaxID=3341728 RepID=UPI003A7FF5BB